MTRAVSRVAAAEVFTLIKADFAATIDESRAVIAAVTAVSRAVFADDIDACLVRVAVRRQALRATETVIVPVGVVVAVRTTGVAVFGVVVVVAAKAGTANTKTLSEIAAIAVLLNMRMENYEPVNISNEVEVTYIISLFSYRQGRRVGITTFVEVFIVCALLLLRDHTLDIPILWNKELLNGLAVCARIIRGRV